MMAEKIRISVIAVSLNLFLIFESLFKIKTTGVWKCELPTNREQKRSVTSTTQQDYDIPAFFVGERSGALTFFSLINKSPTMSLERVSIQCHKTKTKVITLANQKGRR